MVIKLQRTSNSVKLARITYQNREYYGEVNENIFHPLSVKRDDLGIEEFFSKDLIELVSDQPNLNLGEIDFIWQPPLARPGKIMCIGRNYLAHSEEQGKSVEEVPLLFSKYSSCMTGHNSKISYPSHTKNFDYEVELAVIIGKTATKLDDTTNPMDYVFGYTVANDLTARDVQKSEKQWTRGKAFDSSLPIGPFIVTKDELTDPSNKDIWLTVDGEKRQLSNTSKLIFDIRFLVKYISQNISLHPGDIILTGTPEGVGMYMDPPKTLQIGQEVACGVADVGELRFKVVQ